MDSAQESPPTEPDPSSSASQDATDAAPPSNAATDENTSDSQSVTASAVAVDEADANDVEEDEEEFGDALDSVPENTTDKDKADIDETSVIEVGSEAKSTDSDAVPAPADTEFTVQTATSADTDAPVSDSQTEDQEIDRPEEVDMENVNDVTDKDKSVSEDPFDALKQNTSTNVDPAPAAPVSADAGTARNEEDEDGEGGDGGGAGGDDDADSPNATLNNSGEHDNDESCADADNAADDEDSGGVAEDVDATPEDVEGTGATPGDSEVGGDDTLPADSEVLDDLEHGKGVDEELSLLPDAEREISDADKERAIQAEVEATEKEATEATADATALAETKAASVSADLAEADAAAESRAELSAIDARTPGPNEIRELCGVASAPLKCAQCAAEKLCRFQFATHDSETRPLCGDECVAAFREAQPAYTIVAQRQIITLIADTEQECSGCAERKTCKYRLRPATAKNTDEPTIAYQYWCDDACVEKHIAAHPPDLYTVRRTRYDVDEIAETSEPQRCIQCVETKPCRFSFVQDSEDGNATAGATSESSASLYVCNDTCLNLLLLEQPDRFRVKRRSVRVRDLPKRAGHGSATIHTGTDDAAAAQTDMVKMVARTEQEAEAARIDRESSFVRRCCQCCQDLVPGARILHWETMDYCGETCLGLYQNLHCGQCTTCRRTVTMSSLGKYCVRFGFEVRQFCQAACLDTFKKDLKLCSFCQKDITKDDDGFLASVGGLFKDFCTPACMRRYDEVCNAKRKLTSGLCAVCNNADVMQVEVDVGGQTHRFCSGPCFSAFQFVNNINADKCVMCTRFFERRSDDAHTIYPADGGSVPLMYCSKVCQNIYIVTQRRIVPCQWCKVKKYNFDMIQMAASPTAVASGKCTATGVVSMCSLNCLTLCEVSLNAMSMRKQSCDQCASLAMPQYHLTMSDSSIRNFCTYQCVMSFQSQFSRTPLTLEGELPMGGAASAPVPAGLPKRIKIKALKSVQLTPLKQQQQQQQHQHQQQQKQQQKQHAVQTPAKSPAAASKMNKSSGTVAGSSSSSSPSTSTGTTGKGKVTAKSTLKLLASKVPVISNVTSLASSMRTRKSHLNSVVETMPVTPPLRQYSNRKLSGRNASPSQPKAPTSSSSHSASRPASPPSAPPSPPPPPPTPPPPPPPEVKTQIVTIPPLPKRVQNMSTSCRPAQRTCETQCKPSTATIGCQTDDGMERTIFIPVPVPIYIPQPMHMYSLPTPIPVPIPLPIPVPVFIPTTRNSAAGIMKEIRKIQDKMPTDPFEAELLMMAEMVAGDKKKNDSDSGSDDEPDDSVYGTTAAAVVHASAGGGVGGGGAGVGGPVAGAQSNQSINEGVALGDDMLQMALKMAQDYDVPAVDLESAMTANTITPGVHPHLQFEGDINDPTALQHHHMMVMEHQRLAAAAAAAAAAASTTTTRGRKRGGAAAGRNARGQQQQAAQLQQQQQQLQLQQQQQQLQQQAHQQQQQAHQQLQTPPAKRGRRLDGGAMITPVQMHQQQQHQQPEQPREPAEKADANMCLKFTFGVNAWKQWVMTKNADLEKSSIRRKPFNSELLQLTADELNYSLCLFVKEVRKPNGSEYAPDTIYYLVLGIQQYLYENGRIDNIFTDPYYEKFTDCLDDVAKKFSVLYNDSQYIVTRVEEEHLWECKQLGAHSPHVLLSTLMFFNTKHFNLTTVEEHMQLSFSHIMKHWKRNPNQVGAVKTPGSRNVLLRFYPPQATLDGNSRKKKVYEQQENEENPLKCPVKLYEFYLSKCPESVKTRNDVFYLQPERSCVPDSPVWYSTQALGKDSLCKMLHRVKMVKEINIALLTS